ncbi:MAG: hypothetical protein ACKV22_14780 [Bryobacteraceae bacterium]
MDWINREHPEYVGKKAMWRKYRDLYAGGEQFRRNAGEYLVRRSKEPQEVYSERLNRVFYENYIGSIIDWYAATLMRREPALLVEGRNERGRRFYIDLTENCDLRGTDLAEFFRSQLVQALIYGTSYVVVDFPRTAVTPQNRAEEDETGRSRAYLASYTPEEVINWSRDREGNLLWAVLRTESQRQNSVDDSEWRKETQWTYFDREEFRTFERIEGPGAASELRQTDRGPHALASVKRVPLFDVRISEGLWLMNKAALLQLEHFNKSNALAWALTMGLFAMPVVYSEKPFSQVMGESYYIQLGPQDRFGWTEPTGSVYEIAAENLVRLKDEIYRVSYLMSQAASPQSSALTQSGLSKLRDFSITQEVLRAYGDAIKECMMQVLRAIEYARQDDLLIDVSGLDEFDIGDFGVELDDARKLVDLGIQSVTLKKQLYKKLAFKYFCDARQEIKDRISREIDASFGD